MRALGLLAAALLLAGCAAPRSVSPPPPNGPSLDAPNVIHVRAVLVDGLEKGRMPYLGYCTLETATRVLVEVESGLCFDPTLPEIVCAHELGHVLGCGHHPSGFWMRPDPKPGQRLISAPSGAELHEAKTRSKGKTYAVTADGPWSPRMRQALAWACSAWNRALGREALVLLGD